MCTLHSCGVLLLRFFALTVTTVKFANDDKSRVACASVDSTLSICQVIPPPATVICMLRGHTAAVCGECCVLSGRSFLLPPATVICMLCGHTAAVCGECCVLSVKSFLLLPQSSVCCMVRSHTAAVCGECCAPDIRGKSMVMGHTWAVSLPNDEQMMNRGTDRESRKKRQTDC